MRVLFIGGTGNLSLPASELALARGIELVHLNRGRSGAVLDGVETLHADVRDEAAFAGAVDGRRFDAVVDFIAMGGADVERDLRVLGGRTRQYLLVSSASVYLKPPPSHLLRESSPLGNPYWDYSRRKIEAEEVLAAEAPKAGIPFTIVRPAHTYGRSWVPTPFGSSDFTIPARILAGREVPVPGDGQALWTLTHVRDFAVGLLGLLGRPEALGETFGIAGEEALTWDEIHREIGGALGVEPRLVHIPSEFVARVAPDLGARLLGDKAWTSLYDCSKLRRLVPEFRTTVTFHEGLRESLSWLMADPSRRRVNPATEATLESLLAAWGKAMS